VPTAQEVLEGAVHALVKLPTPLRVVARTPTLKPHLQPRWDPVSDMGLE
jgi:hypothetical protein